MTEWIDFRLPTDWKIVPIKETASIMKSGGTPSRRRPDYWKGDIRFVLIEDITSAGLYLSETKETITQRGLSESSAWVVPPGSVLLSMYATIGATAINTVPLATNQAILAIVPKPDYSSEFLAFALRAHKSALSARNVQATQKNVNKGIVETFPIPIPPLDEQHRIAHVLTTVQTAIEQQSRMVKLTRELKSSLMKKLFTEGQRGEMQKRTDLGLVPKSWTTTSIGTVAKLQSGGTPSRDNPKYWKGGTIPWVKTGEINYKVINATEEFITEEGLNNSAAKLLPKGTLLAAMYGQGITRGRVAILGLDATANQACAAITPFDERQVSTWFLYYYMQFHYENLRELGHGANQRNLNMDLIRSFPLSFPKIEEQQEIVDALLVCDKKLSIIEQKHDLFESLFRTLLHQLMTAQIRVDKVDLLDMS